MGTKSKSVLPRWKRNINWHIEHPYREKHITTEIIQHDVVLEKSIFIRIWEFIKYLFK